jgi:prepilin-type N-terminal cleavage/methylation domain-containing protein
MRTHRSRGFTLIELLVVIAIIGVLSAVVLASLNAARAAARDAKRMEDMRQLNIAINAYFLNTGNYLGGTHYSSDPSCVTYGPALLSTALQPLVTGGYIPALPEDPTPGGCYRYSRVTTSALTCGGTGVAAFEYVLMFTTERPEPRYPVAANWPGIVAGNHYCITGPLK